MLAKVDREYTPWLSWLLISGIMLVFIVGLPLIVPVMLVRESLDNRRKRKAATAFVCESCGKTLGIEAITAADRAWAEQVRELRRSRPGVRFRLARRLHAICPHCQTEYTYLSNKRTFIVHERLMVDHNKV